MATTTTKSIKAFGVYYVPTKEGKIFANLKCELIDAFNDQDRAIQFADNCNQGGYLDEMHIGYRVYPMHWIPKGVTVI